MKPRQAPQALVAAALAGEIRFEADRETVSDPRKYRYAAALPGGRRLLLAVPVDLHEDTFLAVLRSGQREAVALVNGSWVMFNGGAASDEPRSQDIDEVVSMLERLVDAARVAGGDAFIFEGSTKLGLETLTLDMHEEARLAMERRPRRFKLFPKPDETRDPERIDRILAKVGELWKSQPDTRLGQLVATLAVKAKPDGSVFLVEDEDIEQELDEELEKAMAPASGK